ncbi:hypothetical protein F5Y05DRAFT_138055 [Hypoxylon sp. FL0543]|nr:hypothetical protein F5Y05DRAFT_138055 [Hypoxylon sp. FL0543]
MVVSRTKLCRAGRPRQGKAHLMGYQDLAIDDGDYTPCKAPKAYHFILHIPGEEELLKWDWDFTSNQNQNSGMNIAIGRLSVLMRTARPNSEPVIGLIKLMLKQLSKRILWPPRSKSRKPGCSCRISTYVGELFVSGTVKSTVDFALRLTFRLRGERQINHDRVGNVSDNGCLGASYQDVGNRSPSMIAYIFGRHTFSPFVVTLSSPLHLRNAGVGLVMRSIRRVAQMMP